MEMYLTVEQTAARLQMHPVSVRRLLARGELRGVKRGRVWRVPESAISESASPTTELEKQVSPQAALEEFVREVRNRDKERLEAGKPSPLATALAMVEELEKKKGPIARNPEWPNAVSLLRETREGREKAIQGITEETL